MNRVCEKCGEAFSRRKKGCCPKCGTPVIAYKTKWVAEDELPTMVILKKYEEIIREHQKKTCDTTFLYRTPKNLLQKELRGAETIYELAHEDLDLAIRTMLYLADSSKYNWRFFQSSSLWHIRSDFNKIVGFVDMLRKKELMRKKSEEESLQDLMDRFGELF